MNSLESSHTITSYDVLKTVAVITMIFDHVGLYLWPEAEMLRVFGRLSAPLWFFLIGFARTRDVPFSWVFWLGIDLSVSAALGLEIKPNVLLTLMLIRLSLDALAPLLYPRSRFTMAFVMFCVVMMPLVQPLLEYGSYAWLLAAVGYWIRRDGMTGITWMTAVLFGYFALQSFSFGFNEAEILVFVGGMMCIAAAIIPFNPDASLRLQSATLAGIYRFCGQYSLIIFAVHLIILKILWFFVH